MPTLVFPYLELRLDPVGTPAFPALSVRLRPLIPVTVVHRNKGIKLLAWIDSGSDTTVLSSQVATVLGLRRADGVEETFCGTSNQPQSAFYYTLTMVVGDNQNQVKYSARVGFTDLPAGCAGLLGQIGLFDHFKVTLDQRGRSVTLAYQ